MENILVQLLTVAYAGVGVAGIIAYWPTFTDLYFRKKMSANIASYKVWVTTSGIALLYGLVIIKDLLFIISASISFLSCVTVLTLSLRIKNQELKNNKV